MWISGHWNERITTAILHRYTDQKSTTGAVHYMLLTMFMIFLNIILVIGLWNSQSHVYVHIYKYYIYENK